MARRIEIDIDLNKIDKSKIRVNEKDGKTYKNYKMVAVEVNGKYGNWMIVEPQKKEERDPDKKSTILGNGKNYGWGDSGYSQDSEPQSTVNTDDLPF